MGPNSKLYLSLIDELFHRGNGPGVTEHFTKSHRSHDPFAEAGDRCARIQRGWTMNRYGVMA